MFLYIEYKLDYCGVNYQKERNQFTNIWLLSYHVKNLYIYECMYLIIVDFFSAK